MVKTARRLFLLLSFVNFVTAQSIRYGGDMLSIPAGSDVAAMGDAGVALPRHAVSSYWNPASASFLSSYEGSAEFADLYQGLSQQGCFSIGLPLDGGVGASILYTPFFSGDIEQFDSLQGTYQERLLNPSLRANGTGNGVFQNYQNALYLSLAKKLSFELPRVAGVSSPLPFDIGIGFNGKGFWQTMNPGDKIRMGMGVNADAGAIVRIGLDYNFTKKEVNRQLLVGITARNILPSKIVWIHSQTGYEEPFVESQLYGLTYIDKSGDLFANWVISAGLERQYAVQYLGGIEAELWNSVAIRAGFSGKVPTVGAGIHYKNYFLDYAFRFDDVAWSLLRVTVGVKF